MTVALTRLPDEFLSVKTMVLALHRLVERCLHRVDTDTPVAPFAGDSLITVGSLGSVVNDQENGPLMGSPALSLAPLTVAV